MERENVALDGCGEGVEGLKGGGKREKGGGGEEERGRRG